MKYTNKEMNSYIKDTMFYVYEWDGVTNGLSGYFDNIDEAMAFAKELKDNDSKYEVVISATEWNAKYESYFHEDCENVIEIL